MATAAIIVAGLLVAIVGGALCGAWVESDVPTPDTLRRDDARGEGHR